LGRLFASLATGSLTAHMDIPALTDFLAQNYSVDVQDVILYLLSPTTTYKKIEDVAKMIAPFLLAELNRSF
jgi:hypothetical protein